MGDDRWGITPIPTTYLGYRFRSRLEARWAVFMDELGIPFEYEPEAFGLDGTPYLPDFWLPHQRCWIEVKPMLCAVGQREFELCRKLARETDSLVFVLTYELWPIRKLRSGVVTEGFGWVSPDGSCDVMAEWGWCSQCEQFVIGEWGLHHPGGEHTLYDEIARDPAQDARIVRAYELARGKRFDKAAA